MALYHAYRPQAFSEIVGQEHIVKTLSNQIKTNKIAHAYIFSGPRGTGKTTTARILAKAINCKNKKEDENEPCNQCSACIDITEGKSIDVIEIDAASHTGVDHVREHIIENAQFRPTFFKYKVFIIDEVHMLSTSAFNALLKTLEEPPAHVIFILATTDIEKIPETILSRCQRFTFHKMKEVEAKDHLKSVVEKEGRTIDDEVLEKIIQKSEGGMRDALSLLDQVMTIDEKHITLESVKIILPQVQSEDIASIISAIEKKSLHDILSFLTQLRTKGAHILQFTDELISELRTILIEKVQNKSNYALSVQEVFSLVDLLLKRRGEIRTSPLPTLPLEMAFIEWMVLPSADDRSQITQIRPSSPPPSPSSAPKKETPVSNNKKNEEVKTEEKSQPKAETVVATPQPSVEAPISEIIKSTPPSVGTVDFKTVERKWNDVIIRFEKESPSLIFILKMAKMVKLEGDTLTISVPYKFHQAKLMDSVNHRKIESILSELCGTTLHFDVQVNESDASSGEDAQELAALVGGQVI